MKVFYDAIISSLQSGGGVSVYFYEIIRRMNLDESFIYFYTKECKNPLINIENFPDNSSLIKDHTFFLERYFDFDSSNNDKNAIFHSSYYRLPKNRKGKKIVTTVHDFTYEKFVSGPALWIHKWQKYRAIRKSDIVICVSKNTAEDLMQYCPVDNGKIRVIHNGVSNSYYKIDEQMDITNEVVFVGARGGYKNFDIAIKAVSAVPELSLAIVGGGNLTTEETKMLNNLLPGRYKVCGRLSDDELNKIYNRAFSLIYPSSYEGFGIPVIEAMKAGCPVIATNASSIPEVAGNAAILVDCAEVDYFVAALKTVRIRREELVKLGLKQSEKFSWDKCFLETYSVYKELAY